jgi:putative flavoprotein involved in K+ transport
LKSFILYLIRKIKKEHYISAFLDKLFSWFQFLILKNMNAINANEKLIWSIIIIGAGQAGLAAGYYLSKAGEDFVIIDSVKKIGDSWRKRWDSLTLFTPSQFDGLPGLSFPKARGTMPSKDEMADYLEKYAEKFNLPIRLEENVKHLSRIQSGFEINTVKGILKCDKVIIATGTNPLPRIPEFAKDLDKSIYQVHSSQYISPDKLPSGNVLVVGAATSGVEIAIELAGSRQTFISGQPTYHIPDAIFRYASRPYWWFASNILTVNTPIGRRARKNLLKGGGPLVGVSVKDLVDSGVRQIPRMSGVENGQPKFTDGITVNVSSIIWATGFKADFSWIDLNVTDEKNGWPLTKRGVANEAKGMYFMGMMFQYSRTSGLVGGVGKDAAYIAKHIQRQKNGHPDS